MKHFVTIVLCLTTGLLMGQWQLEPGMPDVDLYQVQRYDAAIVNVAGDFSLVRTENDGAQWDSTYVTTFGAPFPCTLYDVHFFGPNTGVATGLMSLGSQYVVLRTTDAGANWDPVYVNSTGPLVRWLRDMDFATSTTGIAVGTGGRIVRTTDGGATWSAQATPTQDDLWACSFTSATDGVVVGDGLVWRTTNGGSSWTSTYSGTEVLRAVSFPDPNTGYAAGENNALLKTTDGGLSWSPVVMNVAEDVHFTGIHFSSVNTGHATAGDRIWRTADGGVHWEWFPCVAPMNGIAASGPGIMAVGEDGALYRDAPGGPSYVPVPFFTLATNPVCQDSLIQLTNGSAPGLSSTWLLNGVPFANTTDATLTLTEAAQSDTIALVVSNGQQSDTLFQVVSVANSLQIALQLSASEDTVCAGQSAQVQVLGSEPVASYQLRRNGVNVGPSLNGNNGTLDLNTGPINADDTLYVVATKIVPGCGTNRDSVQVIIRNGTPDLTPTVQAADPVVCDGDATTIELAASEPGVEYQLLQGGTATGPPQTGTGGPLVFPTGPLTASATFTLEATGITGCSVALDQSATVTISRPEPYFTLGSWNPVVGDTVSVVNSTDPGNTHLWDFGPGALPPTSTDAEPQDLTFTQAGPVNVTLTVTSPEGCTNTATLPIHVIHPPVADDCDHAQGHQLFAGDGVMAVSFGPDGELYQFFDNGGTVEFAVHSGRGDTIRDLLPQTPVYDHSNHLVKHDARGIPQWMVRLWHGSTWAVLGDVEVDANGNSYAAFWEGESNDSLRIYGTDGRYVALQPPWSGSFLNAVVVVSWDPNGLYRWHATYLEEYTVNSMRLRLDGAGHLYVGSSTKLCKFNTSDGQQLWEVPTAGNIADLVLDANGEPWCVQQLGLDMDHYDTSGSLIASTPQATGITVPGAASPQVVAEHLAPDGSGGFLISGRFRGRNVLGGDTLDDLEPPLFLQFDQFICRFVPGQGITWAREIDVAGDFGVYQRGLAVQESSVYLMLQAEPTEVSLPGCPPVPVTDEGWLLAHLDTAGATPRLDLFSDQEIGTSNYLAVGQYSLRTLEADPTSSRLAVAVNFSDTVFFGGDTLLTHPDPFAGDFMIALSEPGCLMASLPSPSATPVSFFTQNSTFCAGVPVQLEDASLNGATSWTWQITGAAPSTSNDQDPLVTFPAPGSYAVTLTTANANGTGTSYTSTVTVDVCTAVQETAPPAPTVAPNPVQEVLRIEAAAWEQAAYMLIDATGRTVIEGRLGRTTQVDVSDLEAGVYVLYVTATHGSRSTRVVVQR